MTVVKFAGSDLHLENRPETAWATETRHPPEESPPIFLQRTNRPAPHRGAGLVGEFDNGRQCPGSCVDFEDRPEIVRAPLGGGSPEISVSVAYQLRPRFTTHGWPGGAGEFHHRRECPGYFPEMATDEMGRCDQCTSADARKKA